MGTIHCYASYMKENEDVALNSMSAGWMNRFVEVVLGGAIVIPIAVGYLGIDRVKEMGSFAMGFITLPYLFFPNGVISYPDSGFMYLFYYFSLASLPA